MKIKITYFDYSGIVKAKIINSIGWYSVMNDIIAANIYDFQIIKIEKILEAESENIEDTTNIKL